ncbi:polysaccharide deacetylase family protein [Flavisolibacter tropicus]|uniref:polysaccharide deacetylase family protein n=1 Tax=Flavisolibacter tropicus TaxID=1492898 RepID=UPI0008332FA4|nr:polysaccharide deacetylase family protein [Flavisolibacter tropicus]
MAGVFTISLDFELHWGVFDKKDRDARKQCYQNTLLLIPKLLDIFSRYDVHVTWATVGSLFAANREEWESLKPSIEPDYVNTIFSPYKWIEENGLADTFKWAHFAPEEVKMIMQYPGQELGTHTFSHYYCAEPQRVAGAFRADLQAAKKAAAKFNTNLRSLVFPRNQFNEEYLNVCFEEGVEVVRSNPNNWFWTPVSNDGNNLLRKIFRTGDGYLKMGNRTSYSLQSIVVKEGEPIQLPASRLLRSWSPSYKFTNKLRLRRLIQEMREAAKHNECYHLWWHPENFGDHPEENIKDLLTILEAYQLFKDKYGMQSWNMGEYIPRLRGNTSTAQYPSVELFNKEHITI